MDDGKILVVMAHPDDESFGPGGTIAKFAKRHEVQLICVTDGNDPRKNGRLSDQRSQELKLSAAVLGISGVHELNYPDGALCNGLYHELAAKIKTIVDRVKPFRLITFEPRGVSGHLDHTAVSLITTYVYEHSPEISELWYYCEAKEVTDQVKNYFIYFPDGFRKDQVDTVISVNKEWNTKVEAMRQHQSQMQDVETILTLKEGLPKEEYFLVKNR